MNSKLNSSNCKIITPYTTFVGIYGDKNFSSFKVKKCKQAPQWSFLFCGDICVLKTNCTHFQTKKQMFDYWKVSIKGDMIAKTY